MKSKKRNHSKNISLLSSAALFAGSLVAATPDAEASSLLRYSFLGTAGQVRAAILNPSTLGELYAEEKKGGEAKCGEGKCGDEESDEKSSSGSDKSGDEGKCGEGKCA